MNKKIVKICNDYIQQRCPKCHKPLLDEVLEMGEMVCSYCQYKFHHNHHMNYIEEIIKIAKESE